MCRRSLGGRSEGGRDDATLEALRFERSPEGKWDVLAEGWCARFIEGFRWFGEVERSMQKKGWVVEWDVVSPSNVFGCVGGDSWLEFNAVKVFDDAIGGSPIAMPDWPPASMLFRKCVVGGGEGEEVAIVCGWRSDGERGLTQVDLDEGKEWTKACLKAVSDEEETVRGSEDGGMKVSGRYWWIKV